MWIAYSSFLKIRKTLNQSVTIDCSGLLALYDLQRVLMAGLIPQTFIDDLLNRTDIVEVIDKRVILKKAGKNYTACCPFHQEKTPSFSVQPDRQFYYCFGCGAGGNAIGFVMNFDQLDFPLAVETLAKDVGLEVPKEETPVSYTHLTLPTKA